MPAPAADRALRAVAVAGSLVVVALLTVVPPGNNDLWLQLTVGSIIRETGEIPRTVLFPFTEVRDFPFHAHEWLASVVFSLLHEALGFERLGLVTGAFGMATFALAWRLAWRHTGDHAASLFLALVTLAVINFRYHLRPELFALLFAVLELNLLAEYRLTRRPGWLIALLPLALAWANCHGSFVVGLAIAGLFAAGEAIAARRAAGGVPYAFALAGMAAASLVNPLGYKLFYFAWDLRRWELMRAFINEWSWTFSPVFTETRGFPAYLYLLALCAAALVVCWRRLGATDALLLATFAALSADRNRYIVFFAVAALYVLARLIGPLPGGGRRVPVLVALLCLVGAGALVSHGNFYRAYPYETPSLNFTAPLVEYIEANRLEGNVLNSYELGAELIHRFYPRLRPSIDSRLDSYGEMYFLHALRLLQSEPQMVAFIGDYDVRYMLLLWRDFEQVRAMSALPASGWTVRFADHKMVLLGRAPTP
jgi:hypothetical protein